MKRTLLSVMTAIGLTSGALAMAVVPQVQDQGQDADAKKPEVKGDPYPLDVCPISGGKLGSMGDPIVKVYEGREVRFCCNGCPPAFEKDLAAGMKKLDEKIIASQLPYYPTTECVAMGDSLIEDGEDIGLNVVVNNRLFRLCCRMCETDVKKAPGEFAKKLDEAVVGKQRPNYPMKTCVVGGAELGSMGEPVEVVIANHLVRLCCEGCVAKLKENPSQYLAKIEEAWKAQEREGGAGPLGKKSN